jgi:type VI secretion system protein
MSGILSRRALIPLLLAAPALQGCSLYHMVVPRTVRVQTIAFHVAKGINDDAPVAVDIAYLDANKTLTAEVAKMTAADWFRRKAQLRRDFRDELDVVSWELVPGTDIPRKDLDEPNVDRAAFMFARYHAPGPHRYRLTDDDEDILVTLNKDDFTVIDR